MKDTGPAFWTFKHTLILVAAVAVTALGAGWLHRDSAAVDAPSQSAFDTESDASFVPGTETLASNEMRITALGTGMPVPFRNDASTSWVLELGNGDIFLFDIGSGTAVNFNSLRIPYARLKGIFLSHLHVDHVGDFLPYWISGWTAGRYSPMRIWGPSGTKPEFGTAHFVERQLDSVAWDIATRQGVYAADGAEADVHEFDFSEVQVIYQQDGVKVTSFPQPHGFDGAVGYRLDWQGLSFVYGGDAAPNRWFIEHGRDADVLVHEAIILSGSGTGNLAASGLDFKAIAGRVLSLHTTPTAVARVFELTQPRLAVINHYINLPEFDAEMREQVEAVYGGPVVYASDLTVINVTADKHLVRKAVLPQFPPRTILGGYEESARARRESPPPMSEWLQRGLLDLDGDNYPDLGGARGMVFRTIMDQMLEDFPPRVDPETLREEPEQHSAPAEKMPSTNSPEAE